MDKSMEVMFLRIGCPLSVFILHAYDMYVRPKYPAAEFYLFTLILPSVISITISTMITKQNVLMTRYSFPVIIGILNMCYSENLDGDHELFFISINWVHLIRHLLYEVGLLLKLLKWYVGYVFRCNGLRVVVFVVTCAIQSILILFILDKIFVTCYNMKEVYVNYVFKNSVVESEISTPTLHHKPLIPLNRITQKEVTVYKLQWDFVCDYVPRNVNFRYEPVLNEKYSLAMNDWDKICEMEIISSVGGDASIHCELTYLNQGMYFINQNSKLFWSHNGDPVVINDNLYVENNFTNGPGKNNVTSNLSIYDLNKKHFGEYKLWLETERGDNCLQFYGHKQCINFVITVTKTLLGKFILREMPPHVATLYVPVGGLLLIPHLTFHFHSDTKSINVLHKINNSLFSNRDDGGNWVCQDDPFHGCSILMSAYFHLAWTFEFEFQSLNSIHIRRFVNTTYEKHITSYIFYSLTCICEKAYGEHSFVIQRDFYNKSSKKIEIIETELPWKFLVLPKNWMFQITPKNYSTVYEDIAGEYIADSHEPKWQKLLKSLLAGEDAHLRNRQFIETCFIAICMAALFVFLKTIAKVYIRYIIVPLRCIILEGQIWSYHQQHKNDFARDDAIGNILWDNKEIYDAMVISTEQDSLWVETVALPLLEQEGYKVYYPRRDDTPGVPKLSLASLAVSQSRNFIVICSEEFQSDVFENSTVFSQFVLTKIEDYLNSRLLMIKISPCKIPKPLIWRNDQVYVNDWTTQLSQEEKIRFLRKWIKRCKTI